MSPFGLRLWNRRPDATPHHRDPLGHAGERLARRELKRRRYRIVGRNVRVPMGEADLVCMAPDGVTPVIVEVKTRRTDGSARELPPEVALDQKKRRKLVAIARHLITCNNWERRATRIDLIAIEWPRDGEPVIRHHENAVQIHA